MDKSAVDATFSVNLVLLIFVIAVTTVFYDLNIPVLGQFIVINGSLGIATCLIAFFILLFVVVSDDYIRQSTETDNRKDVTYFEIRKFINEHRQHIRLLDDLKVGKKRD
jgi:hypothetical protein